MKKFAGHKSSDAIKQQCEAAGIEYDQERYENGGDHVVIVGGGARILYNTVNGRFFGTTPEGIEFDSNKTEHEEEPWFQALLSFFYIEKDA